MSELASELEALAAHIESGDLTNLSATAEKLREAAAALSRLRAELAANDAAWEKSRDLLAEQYRQAANALSRAEAEREEIRQAVFQITLDSHCGSIIERVAALSRRLSRAPRDDLTSEREK